MKNSLRAPLYHKLTCITFPSFLFLTGIYFDFFPIEIFVPCQITQVEVCEIFKKSKNNRWIDLIIDRTDILIERCFINAGMVEMINLVGYFVDAKRCIFKDFNDSL